MDVQGKIGLHNRIKHEKYYQKDVLFILGLEKVVKMQDSVI